MKKVLLIAVMSFVAMAMNAQFTVQGIPYNNPKMKNYERIQGIVMDTRYLMYNYIGTPEQQKKELAECIEKVLSKGLVSAPRIR